MNYNYKLPGILAISQKDFDLAVLVISRVQIKSLIGKALETVNCCAFLKRRLTEAC
jgi:hypothetical protein